MNINQYTFEGKTVDLAKAPPVSGPMITFLRNEYDPNCNGTDIARGANWLQFLADRIKFNEQHPILNGVLSVSLSVITFSAIALVASSVIFSGFPIISLVVGTFAYYLLADYNFKRDGFVNRQDNIWNIGLTLIGGPFVPLIGLKDVQGRLDGLSSVLKAEIDDTLRSRRQVFTNPEAITRIEAFKDSDLKARLLQNVDFYAALKA